jgi:hypothetical protein
MAAFTRSASTASAIKSEICAQCLVEETLLERLSQDLEDMVLELEPLIHKQDTVVRQRHRPRQEPLAAAIRLRAAFCF